jgi:hypothetical protein
LSRVFTVNDLGLIDISKIKLKQQPEGNMKVLLYSIYVNLLSFVFLLALSLLSLASTFEFLSLYFNSLDFRRFALLSIEVCNREFGFGISLCFGV